jgi:hypothetical protein
MLRSVDWWLVTDVSLQPIGTDTIDCPKTSVVINLRNVTSQKIQDLIYNAAEA